MPGGGTPGPVAAPPPTSVSGGSGGGSSTSLPRILGTVTAPGTLIGDHGAGIISNNGANLIANNGGNIISNNGANLISNNGGNFISKTKYRTLGLPSGPEGALANALIYLTDRDEKFFFNAKTNRVFGTTTDASGNYAIASDLASAFPVGKDAIVNVALNDNLRMTGYVRPHQGTNTLSINLATTLATEFLRGEAYATGQAMGAFDRTGFYRAVSLTESAIASGDVEALREVVDQTGTTITVGVFDLRMDQVFNLRNQYAIALSAVDSANTAVKALSDQWKALFGYRPTAVTTVIGNGQHPTVGATWWLDAGFATGDERGGAGATPVLQVPMGYTYGVATSQRGDVFVSAYTTGDTSGHIRWIRPDGRISSIWLPTYGLVGPMGLVVERQPTDDVENNPGTLLVCDPAANMVLRVPIVDETVFDGDWEKFPMEIVAGEVVPIYDEGVHPANMEGPAFHKPVDTAVEAESRWRMGDEGQRLYRAGDLVGQPVEPNPARYAHLNNPVDVELDELGNIYISDRGNHRIRMIPQVAGKYYGYRALVDADENGLPDRDGNGDLVLGAEVELQPGCIYTIAGSPVWDAARSPDDGGRWFGEYADSDGRPAQLARLDQPAGLAFRNGALYVADYDNQRVRRINRAGGQIQTVAGSATARRASGTDFDYTPGTSGDGMAATLAQLSFPRSLAFDAQGRLHIADTGSGRIRMVDAAGVITTIGGRLHEASAVPTDNVSDGEALRWADMYDTQFIDLDPAGNVLLTDLRHRRVRKLWRQWE